MSGILVLREETPDDHLTIGELLIAAFQRPDEADLLEALRNDGDLVFGRVAAEGALIIGYAALSKMKAPFPALGLGPVAVAAAHRGKGIASALLRGSLTQARNDKWRAIFVLGDPAFYGRFGFRPELAASFDSPYSGLHFMALPLNGALPANEGSVDYAPAFGMLGV